MPPCGFADYFKFANAHPAFSLRHFSFYSRMADVFTPEKRSEVMSRIQGRDTKPDFHCSSEYIPSHIDYRTIRQNLHFHDVFLQSYRVIKIPFAVDKLLKSRHHEIDNL
jgi:hypothetical protein